MVRIKSKRTLVTILVVIAIAVLVGVIAIVSSLSGNSSDPYTQSNSDQTTETPSSDAPATDTPIDSDDGDTPVSSTPTTSSLDPETVSTVVIEPMAVTVSYVKGIGGFEYGVLLTPDGTQYVEFSSAELKGGKCTNDQGAFASIIKEPGSDEASTITQKTTVDGKVYGLSLAAASCTSNPDLLAKYQKSFSDAFSLLKKI